MSDGPSPAALRRATLSTGNREGRKQEKAAKADDGTQAEPGRVVFEDNPVHARRHA
jgi:hypothetical protein